MQDSVAATLAAADTPVAAPFRAAWWLGNAHLQTLWPTVARRRPRLPLVWHRLELADGDFIDLAGLPPRPGPVIMLLHGLAGSVHSPYAAGLMHSLHRQGFNPVQFHFRSCSGEPNRLPRLYHSGDTADLAPARDWLRAQYPHTPLYMVGFSLGANVLLKWLGDCGAEAGIDGAAAVSVPFNLHHAATRLSQGFSRIYQSYLLRKLRHTMRQKAAQLRAHIDFDAAMRARNFFEYDDLVTAPLHGFAGVDDYYERVCCVPGLRHIAVPCLILHARDDPFMYPHSIPAGDVLSTSTRMEVSAHGGHVGFIAGTLPGRAHYWLEGRLARWFAHLATLS